MSETVTCCREWAVRKGVSPILVLWPADGVYDDMIALSADVPSSHCRLCGARFTLRPDGTAEVGPSVEKLLAGIKRIVSRLSRNTHNCPRDTGVGCPYCLEPDGDLDDTDECDPLDRDADQVARCWIAVGWPEYINDTRALWARMEEAASKR